MLKQLTSGKFISTELVKQLLAVEVRDVEPPLTVEAMRKSQNEEQPKGAVLLLTLSGDTIAFEYANRDDAVRDMNDILNGNTCDWEYVTRLRVLSSERDDLRQRLHTAEAASTLGVQVWDGKIEEDLRDQEQVATKPVLLQVYQLEALKAEIRALRATQDEFMQAAEKCNSALHRWRFQLATPREKSEVFHE